MLDWLYLGDSPNSRMTRPPKDLELQALNTPRLRRLAGAMRMTDSLDRWIEEYHRYQSDVDVRENSATRMRL